MLSCPTARPRTRPRGTHPHVLLSCSQTVPMPQMSADSAGVSVGVKLEPKDRLEYRAASTGNLLIFHAVCGKMLSETLKSGSPQSVVTTLRACEECLDHSAQQSCDCTVALLYPRALDFSRAETGDRVYCVRSEKSGGVGYLLRSTPLFAFPAGPGAGPETASPREPPCRKPQRIYIVKERGHSAHK